MRVGFHPRALKDVQRIRGYISSHGSTVSAERVRNHLISRIDKLRDKPDLGPISQYPGVRVLAPTRYPYNIYYTIQDEFVLILHVRHTSRSTLKELK